MTCNVLPFDRYWGISWKAEDDSTRWMLMVCTGWNRGQVRVWSTWLLNFIPLLFYLYSVHRHSTWLGDLWSIYQTSSLSWQCILNDLADYKIHRNSPHRRLAFLRLGCFRWASHVCCHSQVLLHSYYTVITLIFTDLCSRFEDILVNSGHRHLCWMANHFWMKES